MELRLQQKGFVLWDKKGTPPECSWYAKQFTVCKNLLGTNLRVDFMVNNQLIIECKWQGSAGSVDEKYPWTMMNLVNTGIPSIMILEGGGCRPAMVKFLRNFAKESELVTLCDLGEFYRLDF